MSKLEHDSDPYHPIIDRPWEYHIVGFCFIRDLTDQLNARIDLTLQKGSDIRRLRFLGVQDISIGSGFPNSRADFASLMLAAGNWMV